MQKFYIHQGNKHVGPFSVEELKELKITRDTMVWFEGAESWKKALEIDELKEILKCVPPPIQTKEPLSPPPLDKQKNNDNIKMTPDAKPKQNYMKLIIIGISVLLLVGFGAFIYTNQQAKQAEIQSQLEEQNAKIQEQEKIEAARSVEEQKQKNAEKAAQKQAELDSLIEEYNQAIITLDAAINKLEEIKKFVLLRTPEEKQQQIDEQLETISFWENKVEKLKNKIDKY